MDSISASSIRTITEFDPPAIPMPAWAVAVRQISAPTFLQAISAAAIRRLTHAGADPLQLPISPWAVAALDMLD